MKCTLILNWYILNECRQWVYFRTIRLARRFTPGGLCYCSGILPWTALNPLGPTLGSEDLKNSHEIRKAIIKVVGIIVSEWKNL